MAEIATIARPYAEALFRSVDGGHAAVVADEVQALANVAMNDQLRQFADSPKVTAAQVFEMMTGIVTQRTELGSASRNLLQAVIDNGRLSALPEIASQFQALLNVRAGMSHATIYSAFSIDDGRLADVVSALERRFGRKLTATVEIEPDLIGGLRAVVGDEVLDTSVKARLEQMKAALTA